MKFELAEIKTYWAILSYTDDGEVLVLDYSQDCQNEDFFMEGVFAGDSGIDTYLFANEKHGVYKVELSPVYNEDDPDDRYLEELRIEKKTLIFEFPNSDSE